MPAFAAALLALGPAATGPRPVLADGGSPWRLGEPVAIAVRDGVAAFDVPADAPAGDLLVVVSSLSREAGPFPMRLSNRAVERATPVEIAPEAPARPPRLVAPAVAAEPEPPLLPPEPRRDFHIMTREGDVGIASNYEKVAGTLSAVGRRVQVYVADDDRGRVDAETLADVVETFDDHVHPVAARTIGLAEDADGDGRFTVFFSSRLTRLAGGRHAVDGYVRVTDLDPAFPPPFGDRGDVMHLSTALRAGPHLRAVMAHEYTHAVVYTRKSLHRPIGAGTPLEEEGWLDEAMAHLNEDLHGFGRSNLDYRVSAFLSRPERYRLVVDDYYSADLFRSHGNRGSTYLFLRWCADRFGPDLLPTLVASELHGVANLEAATGRRFEDLFRAWAFDLHARPEGPAFAGYRDRDRAGTWPAAGPRPSRVAEGRDDLWEAAGASPRHVLVDRVRGKAVRVRVESLAESDLQVTAAILPAAPRVDLSARAYASADGGVMLRLSARERGVAPARLVGLAWEPVTPPPDAHRSPIQPGRLGPDEFRAAFGPGAIPAGGSLDSRPIRLGPAPLAGPLVVKLLALAPDGRPVTAWASLGEDPPPALIADDGRGPARR